MWYDTKVSGLKMDAAGTSEILVSYHIITLCYNPQDSDFKLYTDLKQ